MRQEPHSELNPVVLSSFIRVATKLMLGVYFFSVNILPQMGVCCTSRFVISTFGACFFSLVFSYSGQRLSNVALSEGKMDGFRFQSGHKKKNNKNLLEKQQMRHCGACWVI